MPQQLPFSTAQWIVALSITQGRKGRGDDDDDEADNDQDDRPTPDSKSGKKGSAAPAVVKVKTVAFSDVEVTSSCMRVCVRLCGYISSTYYRELRV